MSEWINLYTPWGEEAETKGMPWANDYPRPQLVRNNWQNLNGVWGYKIQSSSDKPEKFDEDILVPFSPESLLSGVQTLVKPEDVLWYQREFKLERELASEERVRLHFGAVDQCCEVIVNDVCVGKHVGGYWPFSFDITDYLQETNELLVSVKDSSDNPLYAYGKQKMTHGEIWYLPQSGIWQTVWLEIVPVDYIEEVHLVPDYDKEQVSITVNMSGENTKANVMIYDEKVLKHKETIETGIEVKLPMCQFKSWSPDSPFLYDVVIETEQDSVSSYFGMRKFSVGKNKTGQTIPLLNNQPIFFNGLLDQGYWSDGLYTPPSDEAMIWDIQKMKALGFNMLRKHIKIEPLRWYYHCDRLGMIVWQDFVSGGKDYSPMLIQYLPFVGIQLKDNRYKWFRRESAESRRQFEREMTDTVRLLKNVTSLAVWVPFNEGWGQFDSTRIGDKVRELDDTRLIDYVSGYHDQGAGDFKSPHIYYKKYRLKPDRHERIQILSEFGGYSSPTSHHMGTDKLFGYKMYETHQAFSEAYAALYEREILPAIHQGLSGTVYTQLSDVEEEINGLVTYDRKVVKIDEELVKEINHKIYETFNKHNQ